jgi:hypothetical protein
LRRHWTTNIDIVESKFRVDAAFTIADFEEATVSPSGIPAVLANPTLLIVVVTDNTNTVIAERLAGNMSIDSAGIGIEVLEDFHPGDHRTFRGEYVLTIGNCEDAGPVCDLYVNRYACLAWLVIRCVWKARLQTHPVVLAEVESGWKVPA